MGLGLDAFEDAFEDEVDILGVDLFGLGIVSPCGEQESGAKEKS